MTYIAGRLSRTASIQAPRILLKCLSILYFEFQARARALERVVLLFGDISSRDSRDPLNNTAASGSYWLANGL